MGDTKKLRDKGTGSLEWRRGHRWVKVSLPDGTRPRYRLCKEVCTCRAMSDAMAEENAKSISARERARVQAEMDAAEKAATSKRMSVEDFGTLWTSGKLYADHGQVRGLKTKKSADDDAIRLKAHVYPYLKKAVADVTEQDVERCMAEAARAAEKKLGKPWRQATRFQLYQVLRRLFDLAVKPGRLRSDNPVSKDLRPPKDKPKLYSFLYPTELLALLGAPAEKVPLARRMLVAIAVYTGLRKGSLRSLTWGSVDFKNSTLTVLETKTGLPQVFELRPDLVAVLQAYYELRGSPKDPAEAIIRQTDLGCRKDREAGVLRDDLKAAGVTRSILFSDAPNVEQLRFHDMRATFVTWARRQGKSKGWIADRTGHLTDEMMNRYDRGARLLADLKYEPFPDISKAFPEFTEGRNNVRHVDFRRG
jgi:integrase